MSKLRFTAALSLATITGFNAANAQAPVGQPVQSGQPATRPNQPVIQQADSQINRDAQQETRRGSASGQMQQGPTVKEALVQKLIKSNDAEIALAQMAQEKSDNEEVKQFAAMIIQDHQQFTQTLQQHAGKKYSGHQNSDAINATNPNRDNPNRDNPNRDNPNRDNPNRDNPNRDNPNRDNTNRDKPNSQDLKNEQVQPNRASGNQDASDRADSQIAKQPNDRNAATVPMQLCKVSEQACDNALKMTKDLLSKYEGQDFNMAYLGQQTVAHITTLAELKAIASAGPKDLQPIASQAVTKVEAHLEKAKQISKKLEDDRKPQR